MRAAHRPNCGPRRTGLSLFAPTSKHGELMNVGEGAQALPTESAPEVAHKNLCALVEKQLTTPAAGWIRCEGSHVRHRWYSA